MFWLCALVVGLLSLAFLAFFVYVFRDFSKACPAQDAEMDGNQLVRPDYFD